MVLIVLPIVGDVGGSPRRLPVVLGGWRCFRRLRMEAWRLAGTSNRSRSSSPSSSSSSSTSSEDELEEHGPSSLRVAGRYLLLLHSSFSTLVRANEGTISDSLRFPFPFPFPFHDSSSRLFFLRLSPSRLCLDSSSSASVLRTLDPAREAGADLQTTLVWLTFPSVVPARCSRTCAHSNGGRLCSLGLFVASDNVELVFLRRCSLRHTREKCFSDGFHPVTRERRRVVCLDDVICCEEHCSTRRTGLCVGSAMGAEGNV